MDWRDGGGDEGVEGVLHTIRLLLRYRFKASILSSSSAHQFLQQQQLHSRVVMSTIFNDGKAAALLEAGPIGPPARTCDCSVYIVLHVNKSNML